MTCEEAKKILGDKKCCSSCHEDEYSECNSYPMPCCTLALALWNRDIDPESDYTDEVHSTKH